MLRIHKESTLFSSIDILHKQNKITTKFVMPALAFNKGQYLNQIALSQP